MSAAKRGPKLRLIRGGLGAEGEADGAGGRPIGRLVDARFGLPSLEPGRATLVFATLADLASLGLERCLCGLGVAVIIDLRVAPAFAGLGIRGRSFADHAAAHGARYVHLEGLANRYVGDSWHAEHYRIRLRAHYRDHAAALEQLRALLDDGPALLLVAERSAIERELLSAALRRINLDVEVHALHGTHGERGAV